MFDKVTDDGKAIAQMVETIGTRSKSIVENIQVCAVSIVLHAVRHGDVTAADQLSDQLCGALKTGWKVETLRAWFTTWGPFKEAKVKPGEERKFKLDGKECEKLKARFAEKPDAFIQARMDDLIWTARSQDQKPRKFDFHAEMKRLLKRAKEKQEAVEAGELEEANVKLDGFEHFDKLFKAAYSMPKGGSVAFLIKEQPEYYGLLNALKPAKKGNGRKQEEAQHAGT